MSQVSCGHVRAYEAAQLEMNVNPKSLLDPRFPEAKGMSRKQLNELAEPFRYNTLIEMINGLAGEGGGVAT